MRTSIALLVLLAASPAASAAPAGGAANPAEAGLPAATGLQVAQAAIAQRTFRSPEFGYRFAYPSDWTFGQAQGDVRAVLATPPGANPGACSIAVRNSEEFRGLTQAQLDWSISNHAFGPEDWIRSLGTRFTNVTVKSPAVIKLGKRPARFALADATDANGAPTVLLMFHALTPGRTWHFACGGTGTDAKTAEAAFNARRIEFMRIMSTFAWDE